MSEKIFFFSSNPGKIREVKQILSELEVEILSPQDLNLELVSPPEDGETFKENSLIKARAAFEQTGIPSLADDSGLIVEPLRGKPGIHSARYAGVNGPNRDRANRQKLLRELKGIPFKERKAAFVCALTFYSPPTVKQFIGKCEGLITEEERGHSGFGYDPIFFLPQENKTFGEMPPELKNRYSHRFKALQKFKSWLENKV